MLPRVALALSLIGGLALACGDASAVCPGDQAFCGCACSEKSTHQYSEYYSTDYVEPLCTDDALCPEFMRWHAAPPAGCSGNLFGQLLIGHPTDGVVGRFPPMTPH